MPTNIVRTVLSTVRSNNLISPDESILIGVSGGVDSIVLCETLARIAKRTDFRNKLTVVHIDHGLRPESSAEQEFVRTWVETAFSGTVGFIAKKVDWAKIPDKKTSPEERARAARYQLFEEARQEAGATKIAVAHHVGDRVEWALMRMLQGVPTDGWVMPVCRDNIIRPLFDLTREEIQKYAVDHNLKWVNDSSNFETKYLRNKIRLLVMPLLRTLSPIVDTTILRLEQSAREDKDYFDRIVNEAWTSVVAWDTQIRREKLAELHPALQRRVVSKWMSSLGLVPKRSRVDKVIKFIVGSTENEIIISTIRFEIAGDMVKGFTRNNGTEVQPETATKGNDREVVEPESR